ncbi:hypothetical protein RchiOBHm_Chr6g0299471 [Rosa chinensis]|uniref:Uncharacterized protein n=1 Tax=Rosa chinensis TaxID=74649 RepID=A0A2P6PY82_ROSCH|nr:hypothetical protein RchiOBHm_Chr6g0299471 [Rosa chinensis]
MVVLRLCCGDVAWTLTSLQACGGSASSDRWEALAVADWWFRHSLPLIDGGNWQDGVRWGFDELVLDRSLPIWYGCFGTMQGGGVLGEVVLLVGVLAMMAGWMVDRLLLVAVARVSSTWWRRGGCCNLELG